MEQKEILKIYEKMCKKAAYNARKIGRDLREFPGCMDGDYFAPARDTFRKIDHIFCWTQSFFTGMALLSAEHTGDFDLIKWCNSFYGEYHKKVFETPADTMHDLGFLYTLYSVMNAKLTGSEEMKQLSIKAAEVLAHRFVPNGGYIRAWGRMDDSIPDYVDSQLKNDNFFAHSNGLAIIDCMMNLPLLFWAGEETGDSFYTSIAMRHADTTIKNFIREDGSVCHAYRFDPETGMPIEEFNDCGYAVGSHWARGAAWAVYGFAIAYRYTKALRYKNAALKVANAYLDACGETVIPVWDFRLPKDKPARYGGRERAWQYWDITNPENCRYNVDSSAAAIICCGFLTLLEEEKNTRLQMYVDAAVDNLAKEYLNLKENVPGMLKQTNGIGSYACFGDYFIMELIARMLGKQLLPW